MNRALSPLAAALALAACSSPEAPDPSARPDGDAAALGIAYLSAPLPRVLCSGQPTEAQFDGLAGAGVAHVLHLRPASESGTGWEEARAEAAEVRFERLGIAGGDGLTRANVTAFADALARCGDEQVLVSCKSSNRVGAMFALKAAWIEGASKEEAMALGARAGMRSLTGKVEALLGN